MNNNRFHEKNFFAKIYFCFAESLRPKIPSHKSLEECDKEVKKIEEEMVKLIKGKAPELSHMLKHNPENSRQSPQIGLGAISEETEEGTEDDLEEDGSGKNFNFNNNRFHEIKFTAKIFFSRKYG